MIEVNLIIVIILSVIFGILLFISDFFEHEHHQLHASLIAGISIAYFFLLVLPEVAEGIPEFPFYLQILEYLFIMIGFIFVHITEKLILQKVESKSQRRMRKLMTMEKDLEMVKKKIEAFVDNELKQEMVDVLALKDLEQVLTGLKEQGKNIEAEIENYKVKIQNHINKDLAEFRFFTNYTYHLLVGIIIVGLLLIDFIAGILFFVFAWLRAIVAYRSERHLVFTDLEIYEESEIIKSLPKRLILGLAALTGVCFGLIFELILPVELELGLIYILFSFISGVILYTIVREVIPEKEKGKPLYFLIGVVGFTVIIIILKISITLI